VSPALAHLSRIDPVLGEVIRAVGPCRLAPDTAFQPFQALAHAIAHQQLHGTAAARILARFIETCGAGRFPAPAAVLAASDQVLRAVGFSGAKAAALKDLARHALAGSVPDRQGLLSLTDAAIIAQLTQVRGIGRWTVEMMLIFQLGRPDVLPVDDFGVRNGFRLAYGLAKMPQPRVLAAYGERWAPHRSMAAWYLWRAVELEKAGTLPKPTERVRLPRLRARKTARRAARKKASRGSRRAAARPARQGRP
jgi:DNA-3-methyladenine glycosylase II